MQDYTTHALKTQIGGSVMRERILSRVDFPAPLRPIMPDDLALLHLEGDVLERPEILRFLTRIIRIRRIVLFSSEFV